ncbi:MAG: hypothetical protein RL033_4100 [Pseudomonadota bacterium]|jgi:hypothetical protein
MVTRMKWTRSNWAPFVFGGMALLRAVDQLSVPKPRPVAYVWLAGGVAALDLSSNAMGAQVLQV